MTYPTDDAILTVHAHALTRVAGGGAAKLRAYAAGLRPDVLWELIEGADEGTVTFHTAHGPDDRSALIYEALHAIHDEDAERRRQAA